MSAFYGYFIMCQCVDCIFQVDFQLDRMWPGAIGHGMTFCLLGMVKFNTSHLVIPVDML